MQEVPLSFLKNLDITAANKIMDIVDGPKSTKKSLKPTRTSTRTTVSEDYDNTQEFLTEEQVLAMGHTPAYDSPDITSYSDSAVMNTNLPQSIKDIMSGNNKINIPESPLPDLSNVRRDMMREETKPRDINRQQRGGTQNGLTENDVRRLIKEEALSIALQIVSIKESEIKEQAIRETILKLKKKGLLITKKNLN